MNDLIKLKARRAVRIAIRSGRLVRADRCEKCGRPDKPASDGRTTIQAHHYLGYENPLSVRWVCARCHCQCDPRASRVGNGRAKLTENQVREIRASYRRVRGGGGMHRGPAEDGGRDLAKRYGVSHAQILRIVANANWIDPL
jgi:hypothetical protein